MPIKIENYQRNEIESQLQMHIQIQIQIHILLQGWGHLESQPWMKCVLNEMGLVWETDSPEPNPELELDSSPWQIRAKRHKKQCSSSPIMIIIVFVRLCDNVGFDSRVFRSHFNRRMNAAPIRIRIRVLLSQRRR